MIERYVPPPRRLCPGCGMEIGPRADMAQHTASRLCATVRAHARLRALGLMCLSPTSHAPEVPGELARAGVPYRLEDTAPRGPGDPVVLDLWLAPWARLVVVCVRLDFPLHYPAILAHGATHPAWARSVEAVLATAPDGLAARAWVLASWGRP